jgi:Tfp pilus assembly protein PilF/Ni,Fe-hydrogenase maturation factor
MFTLARIPARCAGSNIALAIALATGAVVGLAATAPAAYAQKQPKSNISKGFTAVYNPVFTLSQAENPDEAALRAGLEQIVAAIENADDRYAAGAFINNIGAKLSDQGLQRRGVGLMIESGKVAPEQIAKFHFIVGQLAYNDDDYPAARASFQQAIDAGYNKSEAFPLLADTHFQEDDYATGLALYKAEMEAMVAGGQKPPREWIARALAAAYNNDQAIPAIEFATILAREYPGEETWRDAINIQRNLVLMEGPELLDLMRLADTLGVLSSDRDYLEYADAADVLRAPGEVKRILEKGIAAGKVSAEELVVKETLTSANSRVEDDKKDLVALEKEAMAPAATASLSTEAADAFLSYQMYDKAEAIYLLALGKPGVDESRANLRLGIAQLMLGKPDEAKASFAKVKGQRRPVAGLWAVYADQKTSAAM